MSRRLIEDYYHEVDKIKQYSGSRLELSLRSEFANLLNSYCKQKNLLLVQELEYRTKKGTMVKPDGTVKDALRLDWGYWESKDEYDDLDKEIKAKLEKGYPSSNIIFEDSQTAVLIQQGKETSRVSINDAEKLDALFQQFINYEREEIRDFRKAIEKFKEDLPTVLVTLRDLIEQQGKSNDKFRRSRDSLLQLCQETINPKVTALDIREMLIQHILTEEIFITIFNESQFHRENTIARELQKVADTFFIGKIKKDTLGLIDHYYLAIKAAASNIDDHHEKQKFLKVLYEFFYRTYNPKAADRLGIFYTPNEIVQFMVKSASYLAYKHFNRLLSDSDVEILDPATGTGTFITELIEQMPQAKLEYKYKNEIHCNEVAILPYYIANLNIEFTYKQKTGNYEPFENICFVDTLDNTGFSFKNKQTTLFDIGTDNLERIRRQNKRKISVIIGNPPYNANQLNENENNKNREYPDIDKRIKETYVKASKATKTKVYDMYARFYRWASDRLDKNGIIAFITNRSYIDKFTYDGFRKQIQKEFNYAYIIDTKSDVRANPKIAGTTHNVFGIQTGVAVMFLVRDESQKAPCLIQYFSLQDEQRKEEKLQWFATTKIEDIPFEHLEPDEEGNWTTTARNDFHELMPLVSEDNTQQAIFSFYSIGVSTNRDEWVFDFSKENLTDKINYFIESYNAQLNKLKKLMRARKITSEDLGDILEYDIKWSQALKDKVLRKIQLKFNDSCVVNMNYRPYVRKQYYGDKALSDRLTSNHYKIFGNNLMWRNRVICFSGVGSSKPFSVLASETVWSLDFLEKTQGVPISTYAGKKPLYNVTDWSLKTFREHYEDKRINREAIFHYVYAILHNAEYRRKYKVNLKRELPRIPFLDDFWQWAKWGEKLMNIHINFLTAGSYRLKRIEKGDQEKAHGGAKLKADRDHGRVILDGQTILEDIPREAWEYKIGNRSAIEWILDQYKEKIPKESVVRERFNRYKFNDYKEQVIDLIQRIVFASIETVRITEAMNETRSP
jgi:predicted helicase